MVSLQPPGRRTRLRGRLVHAEQNNAERNSKIHLIKYTTIATINQLTTWIASNEAKLEKKQATLAKHIANLEKAKAKGADYYDIRYKESTIEECKKNIRYIERDLENYRIQLAEKQAQAEKEANEYDNEMEAMLTDKLILDKQNFIDNAKESAKKTYEDAPERILTLERKIEEMKAQYGQFYYRYKSYNDARDKVSNLRYILRQDKQKFIEKAGQDAKDYYEASIKNMVKKLAKHTINKAAMQIKFPNAIGNGLEMIITDDRNREIYARLIWAAEYSEYVTEHLRFIITEKKTR